MVRNANAFLAAEVHIVGRRRWNRRGAMVTDRYQHVRHHPTIEEFVAWAAGERLPVVGIDNLPGSRPLETSVLPRRCVLLFGQEGPGLSPVARTACDTLFSIAQYGSTRSVNAGVASGIAMHAWIRFARGSAAGLTRRGSAVGRKSHAGRPAPLDASPARGDGEDVTVAVSCPKCAGPVREPDLMHGEYRCLRCGPVAPLHVPEHIGAEIMASVVERVAADGEPPTGPACRCGARGHCRRAGR